MKTIPIKKGLFILLISEAAIITIVAIIFIVNLYFAYTNLIYNESATFLNLYTRITEVRFNEIKNLSFEILSNQDIQQNLQSYYDSPHSYEGYLATKELYTQLFTRLIMNKSTISIIYVFPNGKEVKVGDFQRAKLSNADLKRLLAAAVAENGSCGWVANIAGQNVVTLYRLIKDINATNKFRPLGTLIINIDGNYFFNHTPIGGKYVPEIVCVAGNQVISPNSGKIAQKEILRYINTPNNYQIVFLNNTPYFISVKKINNINWYLVYLLTIRELLSSVYNINKIYILILLVIIFIIIIIGYNFADAISKPIIRLTKTMKVVEEGNYSHVLKDPITESNPAITEIAQLSQRFYRMIQEIDYLINEIYTKQLLIMEMKYKMLQKQINPHFLYNTFDTINWKAIQSGNKDIAIIVKSLAKLLRGSVKGPDIITISEDLSFVDDYISIQKIRFEDRLEFTVNIPGSIGQCRIPRLTLQPIVENSVIHNLEKYAGVCRITMDAFVSEGTIKIIVEDNGRGMDLEHVAMILRGEVGTADESIGLRNIDQRIKMAFGEEFGLTVENKEPTGARVVVNLPYEGEAHAETLDRR